MTDDQPIPPPPKSESDSKNNATHPSGNATPEVEIPPSHSCYQITCNKKRDKWDIAKWADTPMQGYPAGGGPG